MTFTTYNSLARSLVFIRICAFRNVLLFTVWSVWAAVSTSVHGQVSFTPLGLFGGTLSRANDVSADGSVVVGVGGDGAFRWTAAESLVRPATNARAISADGAVIVGAIGSLNGGAEAFRWAVAGTPQGLGDLPGGSFLSQAFDVSADGSVIVGVGTTAVDDEAFRWTAETGMVGLGGLPGAEVRSVALGVSADGRVIVGEASATQAFRWTAETGMVGLGFLPGGNFSQAQAASADGTVVVGTSFVPGPPPSPGQPMPEEAFRWTESEGMVSLGDLPGGRHISKAFDVSADGSVIVGSGDGTADIGIPQAVFWSGGSGPFSLREFLIAAGVSNLDGWRLFEARAVSDDGRTIVGYGRHNDVDEAFVATIPEPSTVVLITFAIAGMLGFVRLRRPPAPPFRYHRSLSSRLSPAFHEHDQG
jgi:probable HAF family extracellular repeat protein